MVSWETLFFFFFCTNPKLFFPKRKTKKKEVKQIIDKELEADDVGDTNSSQTLKGRSLTQFLLGNSCVQKWSKVCEMCAYVTVDTYCHEKEGVKVMAPFQKDIQMILCII